ncbi:disease resistance protein rpm1-like [Trifolium pratense]|uniref:Disease resistance protein rpm1-like n=1 Tax=Trifolium pratense TaxID=57577 RepID=A0A2K3KZP2_TRIPR|nr:disease resistance protein rpm1-like [Trifolium pratense]
MAKIGYCVKLREAVTADNLESIVTNLEIMAWSAVSFLLQRLEPVLQNKVNLLTGVESEVVYLKGQLELITAYLKVADALEESDEELKVWVKQVRDVAHETEDILDELKLLVQARNHTNRFSISLRIRNMKARYRICYELKSINSRMTTIFSIHKRFLRKLDSSSEASSSNYTGITHFKDSFKLK